MVAWNASGGFRRSPGGPIKNLALGGAAAPLVLLLVTTVSGALRPGYSHLDQFISELGATGTPYAGLMNYGGFVPMGLLFLGFAISTRSLVPRARLSTFATVLLVLFAVGGTTAGLASCDLGCPESGGSFANSIHNTVSPIAFVALILAAGTLGAYFRRVPEWQPFWLYSIATSVVALGFMIAMVASLESRELTGLWQRLLLATLFAWSTGVGLRLYRLLALRERWEGSVGSVAV